MPLSLMVLYRPDAEGSFFVQEFMICSSKMKLSSIEAFCWFQHPMRQTDELIFKDRVVVIKTALIGIGPTCRGFPWCRPK